MTSDILYQLSTQSYLTLVEKSYYEFSSDLTWSSSGTTSITYSVGSYNGTTIPSWIVFNTTTGILKITAPSVNSSSSHSFYINSLVSGSSTQLQKLINIQVNKWSAQYCHTWSSSSSSICVSCNEGYTLTLGACSHKAYDPTPSAASAATTVAATVAATVSVVAVSQTLNASSFCTIWSMMNMIQSLFFLALLRIYLPDDVNYFILGMKVFLFPFDSLKFLEASFIFSTPSILNFNQVDDTLWGIGLHSGSSFINCYLMFVSLIIIFFIHIYLLILIKLINKITIEARYPRLSRAINNIKNKIFYFMTFAVYIRIFIEGFQYLMLASMFELHYFHVSPLKESVSLSLACIIIIFWVIFWIWVLWITINRKPILYSNDKLGEIFKDTKENRISRYHTFQILLKKFVITILVSTLAFTDSYACIILIFVFQLIYTIFLLVQRPLDKVKSNLIEII